jgi:uncharacterized protein (TIGR03437 family)
MTLWRMLLCLALPSAAAAATSGFLLGADYGEWALPYQSTTQIATDSTGALYILSACAYIFVNAPSCVTKVSADGKSILWQTNLGFIAAMAVDPNGGVYLVPEPPELATSEPLDVFVEKLSADGSSVLWQTQVGTSTSNFGVAVAVDSTGRAFVGTADASGAYMVRLNPAGAMDYTSTLNLPGSPAGIAVDATGSHVIVALGGIFVALYTPLAWDFARLAPDGSAWSSFSLPFAIQNQLAGLAVAPNGDALVSSTALTGTLYLQRIDATGAVVFAKAIAAFPLPFSGLNGLALDTAGNAYITGYSGAFAHPVQNSLAPCGSSWLGVYAPDGTILQSTYLPGAASWGFVTVSPNSSVFVLYGADSGFTPTQTGPFFEFPYGEGEGATGLLHLSPSASAQIVPLACAGNAASLATGVAPGEIVTLFGNGLGPQQGIQTEATLQSPYPTQAGNVEVTFDGTPAPLLWVQDAQINLAVPWSVAGPTTQVCVTYNNAKTNCLTLPVAEAAPGVFTVDGTYAAAVNQDGSVNSAANPAPPNSIVSIYATGLGPINPPQADGSLVGLPLPVNTLAIRLGAQCITSAECPPQSVYDFSYGGPAPSLIAGASQVNFTAGDAASAELYLQVEISSGGAISLANSNAFRIYVASQ